MARGWKMNRERKYLKALLAGIDEPDAVARKLGMTLEAFSAWASREEVSALAEGLRRQLDVRTQLMLSRQKVTAIYLLSQLATRDKEGADKPGESPKEKIADETLRRVCKDLLTAAVVCPGEPRELAAAAKRAGPKPNSRSLMGIIEDWTKKIVG